MSKRRNTKNAEITSLNVQIKRNEFEEKVLSIIDDADKMTRSDIQGMVQSIALEYINQ